MQCETSMHHLKFWNKLAILLNTFISNHSQFSIFQQIHFLKADKRSFNQFWDFSIGFFSIICVKMWKIYPQKCEEKKKNKKISTNIEPIMIPNKLKLNMKTQCDTQTDYQYGNYFANKLLTLCRRKRNGKEKLKEKNRFFFWFMWHLKPACLY